MGDTQSPRRSRVKFVEPASLLLLIALMHAHQKRGLSVQIVLPRSSDVRDFFRAWKFPQAVHDAIGQSFRSVVHPDDHHYFGERQGAVDAMRFAGRITTTDEGRERMLPTDFFDIRTFPTRRPLLNCV